MRCVKIKYGEKFQKYIDFLAGCQYSDGRFWAKLVKQYEKRIDYKDLGWRGEFWGKLMRGASMLVDNVSNKRIYSVLERTVKDILSKQDEFGRFSTYPIEEEFDGWDIWGRKYVMLGMLYFLEVCRSETLKIQIIDSLCLHANYIMERVGVGKIPINQTSKAWGAVNSYSILQPIVKLYSITKNKKYYDYAIELIDKQQVFCENLFRIAYEDKIKPFEYPVVKAYEMISCFEGLLDFYEITKENKCLETCKKFANAVLESDFTLVGGTGCYDEMFDNSTKKQVTPQEMHMQETCVTVTLMKYLSKLNEIEYNVGYVDAIERSLYNIYLGAFKINGKDKRACVYSYSPLINKHRFEVIGGMKKLGSKEFCGCCIAIAGAGLGIVGKTAITCEQDLIRLNLFIDGSYTVRCGRENLVFNIKGGYPFGDKIVLTVEKGVKKTIKLVFRKPAWVENAVITADGKNISEDKDCFVVQGTYSNGDVIELEMNNLVKLISSKEFDQNVEERIAIVKGAITYCVDARYGKTDGEYNFDGQISFESQKINGVEQLYLSNENGKIVTLLPYMYAGDENTPITVWIKKKISR